MTRHDASMTFAALLTVLTLAGTAAVVRAAATPPPRGRLLSSNCLQCHSNAGTAEGFGHITGKAPSEIYDKLKSFASGKEGQGLMVQHARGYSDQEMQEISAYLSTLR